MGTQRICGICGKEYIATGTVQRFCHECGIIRDKERKHEWYLKHNNDAKPKVKCTDPCCVCGGEFAGWNDGKPYCNKHWLRIYTHGTTELMPRKRTYSVTDNGDGTTTMQIANGSCILIDTEDMGKVSGCSWCISKTGYAVAKIGGRVVKMHRIIMNIDNPDQLIDHINGNKLDNRKSNLRVCTQKQNGKNLKTKKNNKSGYTGVRLTKFGKYNVRITADGREIHIGNFQSFEDAVNARRDAESKYFGEFAHSN